ncbi:hypothetical protein EDEG_01510 [Edhazardia aedis USNM 41457]|uniref:Uncharacterized protein n=1 Tax=Edhazardia aedis (strain USNM 41457) TaxID=1003232 RepID=J9D8W7_EDHAE|nr:hypothetical protein EDEG_01510 [Edhazardia aedis USNM 41457]|eukprot:EJW04201.1 hypothetical protein EDEG_01510 [Edhazardia aedis USNM 41457]
MVRIIGIKFLKSCMLKNFNLLILGVLTIISTIKLSNSLTIPQNELGRNINSLPDHAQIFLSSNVKTMNSVENKSVNENLLNSGSYNNSILDQFEAWKNDENNDLFTSTINLDDGQDLKESDSDYNIPQRWSEDKNFARFDFFLTKK